MLDENYLLILLSTIIIQHPRIKLTFYTRAGKLGTLHLVKNWTFYVKKHVIENLKN